MQDCQRSFQRSSTIRGQLILVLDFSLYVLIQFNYYDLHYKLALLNLMQNCFFNKAEHLNKRLITACSDISAIIFHQNAIVVFLVLIQSANRRRKIRPQENIDADNERVFSLTLHLEISANKSHERYSIRFLCEFFSF